LVATEDTVIEALVALGGAHGTLLTGVPVLIAVLVARQQLEANRRQHVANIKRSLKTELDSLDRLAEIHDAHANAENSMSTKIGRISNPNYIYFPPISSKEIRDLTKPFPFELRSDALLLARLSEDLRKITDNGDYTSNDFNTYKSYVTFSLDHLNNSINNEKTRISQYWS
jgi:hypothetical protein